MGSREDLDGRELRGFPRASRVPEWAGKGRVGGREPSEEAIANSEEGGPNGLVADAMERRGVLEGRLKDKLCRAW